MKLHLDKDAFHVLIESIHNKTGYRSDGVFIFFYRCDVKCVCPKGI